MYLFRNQLERTNCIRFEKNDEITLITTFDGYRVYLESCPVCGEIEADYSHTEIDKNIVLSCYCCGSKFIHSKDTKKILIDENDQYYGFPAKKFVAKILSVPKEFQRQGNEEIKSILHVIYSFEKRSQCHFTFVVNHSEIESKNKLTALVLQSISDSEKKELYLISVCLYVTIGSFKVPDWYQKFKGTIRFSDGKPLSD